MDKDAKRDKSNRKNCEPDMFEEDKDCIDYAAFRARERNRGFDYKRH